MEPQSQTRKAMTASCTVLNGEQVRGEGVITSAAVNAGRSSDPIDGAARVRIRRGGASEVLVTTHSDCPDRLMV